jgi:hypothetical protein
MVHNRSAQDVEFSPMIRRIARLVAELEECLPPVNQRQALPQTKSGTADPAKVPSRLPEN